MYLALYRKYRPKTFEDVVSQEHIITTLKNEVAQQKTAHAYLFTGSRGTGKTTCSKILAMAINCPNSKDGNPCMECDVCKGIDDGSLLDVVEMDAASNNGVDDVRMLREEAMYTPTKCKYRIYIVDEAHMLTASAFNALLKIMEEPPAHVKFILATTEVHKIPATILSRCQRFDFIRIKTEDIAKRLLFVASQENFTLTDEAAFLIAKMADGGMRDALSTLDQCTSLSSDIDVDVVSSATGIVLREYLMNLADMICKKDLSDILAQLDLLHQGSKDLQRLLVELTEYFRNIMIVKTINNPDELVKSLPDEINIMKEQSKLLSLNSILRIINLFNECLESIGHSKDKRLSVEMCFIKLCQPDLDLSKEALLERIESLERKIISLEKNGVKVDMSSDVSETTTPAKETQQSQEPTAEPAPKAEQSTVPSEKPKAPLATVVNKSATATRTESPSDDVTEFKEWADILIMLEKKDPMLYGVLENSLAFTKGQILFIQSPFEFFAQMLKKDGMLRKLLTVMEEQTGTKYRVRIKKNKPAENQNAISPIDQLVTDATNMGLSVYDK